MYEISLLNGFGPIRFGATPSEVKSAWPFESCYEDWMGGNLENFLFFKGLLIGFRGEIKDSPTENSQVCMFHVKTVHPLSIWDHEVTNYTRREIINLLNVQKHQYKVLSNGIIQSVRQELQFSFKENDRLEDVYFAK